MTDPFESLLKIIESVDPQATPPAKIAEMQRLAAEVRLGMFREAFPAISEPWIPVSGRLHLISRQSDEYACSCGKRWPYEEGEDAHP